MDKQTLTNLIEQAKNGSQKAMEQLLIFAHTPVSFQCQRLLNDSQMAEDMTARILKSLSSQIGRIQSADHFHKWLGNVTATRCMKQREKTGVSEYIPDSQNLSFPSNELSKAETAQVAMILADSLSEERRICLLLSACCRVSTKAIAQMTGAAEEKVQKLIAEAEVSVRGQMQVYQNQGVVFADFQSIPGLLRAAMYASQDRSAAAAMVRKVIPPVAPAPAPAKPSTRINHTVKVLLCIALALVLLLVLLICGVLMLHKTQNAEETTLPTTIVSTAATETTEATTQATTEATTEPTTEPTTEATTVPETTEAVAATQATEVPETTAPKTSSTPAANLGAPSIGIPKKPSSSDYNKPDDGHTHQYIHTPAPGNQTCTRAGRIYAVCTLCRTGIEKDDPDRPALGHDYQANIVVPPTTSSRGYTSYKCTRCGNSYDSDFVDPLPAPETQAPVIETQAPAAEPQVQIPDSGNPSADSEPAA